MGRVERGSFGSRRIDGEMRHRKVNSLAQGYTAKNFDASQEQRWSWTTGALDGVEGWGRGGGCSGDGTAALVRDPPGSGGHSCSLRPEARLLPEQNGAEPLGPG